jgi:voltage-gated potassium channel
MTLRKWAFQLLEPNISKSPAARAIEWLLIILIFLNIVAILLESIHEINEQHHSFFKDLETFSVTIFTLEYILRVWTSAENPRFGHSRKRYMLSGMAIIDLLSILPFYLDQVLPLLNLDLRALRIIRLFRLLRLLKIARYLKALNIMQAVLRERKEQIMVSVMFILFLLVIVSTMMYYVENEAQPQKFSSIPATMWWGIETLTTVGYGDMVPITIYGKLLGGMIAILGIGLFALPAGIFSSGLTEHLRTNGKKKHHMTRCPHCGGEIHD